MTLKNVLLSWFPLMQHNSFMDRSSESFQNTNIWARYQSSTPFKLVWKIKEGKIAVNLCLQDFLEKEWRFRYNFLEKSNYNIKTD